MMMARFSRKLCVSIGLTSFDFFHVSSTPPNRKKPSNDKATRPVYEDYYDDDEDRTPSRIRSSSKLKGRTERDSDDDDNVSSKSKSSTGKRISSSKSIIRSDDEELLSPFEEVEPRRRPKANKRQALWFSCCQHILIVSCFRQHFQVGTRRRARCR